MQIQTTTTARIPQKPFNDHPGIAPEEDEPAGVIPPCDFSDISHHQNTVDIAKYAASGRSILVCKVTEGADWVDPNGQSYRADANKAGLRTGLYHFAGGSKSKKLNDPVVEANNFLKQVGTLGPKEFAVLDFEQRGGLDKDKLNDWASKWMATVEQKTGTTPWLYTGNHMVRDFDPVKLGKYPLWLADYRKHDKNDPPDTSFWTPGLTAWQYTEKAETPGLPGPTDGNYLYKDPFTAPPANAPSPT